MSSLSAVTVCNIHAWCWGCLECGIPALKYVLPKGGDWWLCPRFSVLIHCSSVFLPDTLCVCRISVAGDGEDQRDPFKFRRTFQCHLSKSSETLKEPSPSYC